MTNPSLEITPPPALETSVSKPKGVARFMGFIVLLAVAGVIGWFWRHHSTAVTPAEKLSASVVAVAKTDRETLTQYLTLAAEFRPYQEVSVHAKVAGYVKSIVVDIGDRVKAGQVIATLEIPEAQDDLNKAQAEWKTSQEEVKRAEANYEDVHLAFQRIAEVAKKNPKLVAQQDLDTARAKDNSMASALSAARQRVEECEADVKKMRTLLDYSSITAPFDGVITRRYADTGALVQAGTSSNTQAMPLVDIAQEDRLRLTFPVPESAVSHVREGAEVSVSVGSLNKTFLGKITRSSGKVDRATRTMETEVDVENSDAIYTPGMYAFVKLPVLQKRDAVAVPVQALSPGAKPVVYVLKEGRLEERAVTTGLATPDKVEILKGVEQGEEVVIGSRAGLHAGQSATGKITDVPSME